MSSCQKMALKLRAMSFLTWALESQANSMVCGMPRLSRACDSESHPLQWEPMRNFLGATAMCCCLSMCFFTVPAEAAGFRDMEPADAAGVCDCLAAGAADPLARGAIR